jgi:hypothetical protein
MSLPIGVNTGALRPSVLQQISLPRFGATGREAALVSPIIKVDTRQGFYHFFLENDQLQVGPSGNAQSPVGYDSPASPGGLRITSGTYQAGIYRFGQMNFSTKQIAEFEARGSDILATYSRKLLAQGTQLMTSLVGTTIATFTNYAHTDNLTVVGSPTADLQGKLNNLIISIMAGGADLSSGRFVACCNMEVANQLLKLTQVAEAGFALASDSQATGYARTGVTDMSQLKAWFAAKLLIPVELVVFPHYVTTQSTGVSSPAIPTVIGGGAGFNGNGTLSIFKVAETYGDSGFLQTMTPNPAEATGSVHSYPVYNPQGQGMHIECDLGVTVVGATANDPANKFAGLLALA